MALITATGGTITYATIGGVPRAIHTFTSNGTFEITSGSDDVDYLIVAGGGAGGGVDYAQYYYNGGGGGAGGVLGGSTALSTDTYSIVVGAGGSQASSTTPGSGAGSTALGLTADGGGGGGPNVQTGSDGGSGGGGGTRGNTGPSYDYAGGTGTVGQGYDGGRAKSNSLTSEPNQNRASGGGGGAGGVGKDGDTASADFGTGGAGISSDISGMSQWYAAGGGGGCNQYAEAGQTQGESTNGVGGIGGNQTTGVPTAGAANTGSGGGGRAMANGTGADGADGVVILSYPTAVAGSVYGGLPQLGAALSGQAEDEFAGTFPGLTASMAGEFVLTDNDGPLAGSFPTLTALFRESIPESLTGHLPAFTGAFEGTYTAPDLRFIPELMWPGYAFDGTDITIPIAALTGLLVTDADTVTGDWTKLFLAFCRTNHETINAFEETERPQTVGSFILENPNASTGALGSVVKVDVSARFAVQFAEVVEE